MSNALKIIDKELVARKVAIEHLLPPEISFEKFRSRFQFALTNNPALANYDPMSIIMACRRAALDGLMPDGIEGAFVPYNGKITWTPMVGGIQKIISNCGWSVESHVVREGEEFDYSLGDEPYLRHKPLAINAPETPIIGAYAIARGPNREIVREVMTLDELDRVRACSTAEKSSHAKGKKSIYDNWPAEMARKAPLRRLFKRFRSRLPDNVASRVEQIMRREDSPDELQPQSLRTPEQSIGIAPVPEEIIEAEKAQEAHKTDMDAAFARVATEVEDMTSGEAGREQLCTFLGKREVDGITRADVDILQKLIDSCKEKDEDILTVLIGDSKQSELDDFISTVVE